MAVEQMVETEAERCAIEEQELRVADAWAAALIEKALDEKVPPAK